MRKLLAALALIVIAALPLVVHAQDSQTLTVFAASSLTNVFQAAADVFQADHPGVTVQFNFASSSDLAAQLAQGAPADVFASANNRQMTAASDAGRIAGDPVVFAHNRLVVIVPVDDSAAPQTLNDLATAGVRIVIAAQGVPVRDYTETMLTHLAADAAFGGAFVTAFRANVVSEESNVRQVASKVALGEADAGIVYTSDVTADIRDSVRVIEVPDAYNTIASYPIAVTNDSTQPELAAAFIDLILSPEGQQILADAHFITVCATTHDLESTPEPGATPESIATTDATAEATDACPR